MSRGVAIAGAGLICAVGDERRALARALIEGRRCFGAVREEGIAIEPKQRKLMSRSAILAASATARALEEAGFSERREEIGFWCGVGASGGDVGEVEAILAHGLEVSNPLLTFQLLNNFTLCHAAIREGLGGPSSAFYSRGAGTMTAFVEAIFAIESGTTTRALAGGADTALHPVTEGELARSGHLAQGLRPGEGAAILALAASSPRALATIEEANLGPPKTTHADLILLAPWGPPAKEELTRTLRNEFRPSSGPSSSRGDEETASFRVLRTGGQTTAIFDLSQTIGETLAASPAIAVVAALGLLEARGGGRALVLTLGIDGAIGSIVLCMEPAR